MSILSYSQKTFPKKIIINSDTLVLITVPQMREINLVYERFSICDTVRSLYKREIQDYQNLAENNTATIENFQSQINLQDSIVSLMTMGNDICTDRVREKNIKIRGLEVQRNVFLGVSLIFAGFLLAK